MWPIYLAGAVVAALFLSSDSKKPESEDSESGINKSKTLLNNQTKGVDQKSFDSFTPSAKSDNLVGPWECPVSPYLWRSKEAICQLDPIEIKIPENSPTKRDTKTMPTVASIGLFAAGCSAPSRGVGLPSPSASPPASVEPPKRSTLQPRPPIGLLMFQPPANGGQWVRDDEFFIGFNKEKPRSIYRFKEKSTRPVRFFPLIRDNNGKYRQGNYTVRLRRADYWFRLATVKLNHPSGDAEFDIPDGFKITLVKPSKPNGELTHEISNIILPSPFTSDSLLKGVLQSNYDEIGERLMKLLAFFPNEITPEFIDAWADLAFKNPEYQAPGNEQPFVVTALVGLLLIGKKAPNSKIRKAAIRAFEKLSTSKKPNLAKVSSYILRNWNSEEISEFFKPWERFF